MPTENEIESENESATTVTADFKYYQINCKYNKTLELLNQACARIDSLKGIRDEILRIRYRYVKVLFDGIIHLKSVEELISLSMVEFNYINATYDMSIERLDNIVNDIISLRNE